MFRKRTGLLAALMGLLMLAGLASPAQASATGCAAWGKFTVAGYGLAQGQYCFTIRGSGLRIDGTLSSYNTPVMYNWSETVRFYDLNGRNYSTFNLPVRNGRYVLAQSWSLPISGTAARGKVCGEFKSSGVTIATVCHHVY